MAVRQSVSKREARANHVINTSAEDCTFTRIETPFLHKEEDCTLEKHARERTRRWPNLKPSSTPQTGIGSAASNCSLFSHHTNRHFAYASFPPFHSRCTFVPAPTPRRARCCSFRRLSRPQLPRRRRAQVQNGRRCRERRGRVGASLAASRRDEGRVPAIGIQGVSGRVKSTECLAPGVH